ncbi:MAG TPA: hypothetical protein PK264_18620, partial [Hyphomicrobiaceae bacterium]|nr:hypothetical protein [Hyphomicrobiaceae bacterium]
RPRLLLWPLVLLATAGALSALPILTRWPLVYGHGGMIGDLSFKTVSGLFALINPGRAGVAAGLMLFAAAA